MQVTLVGFYDALYPRLNDLKKNCLSNLFFATGLTKLLFILTLLI